jgi:hypothetical protein
VRHAVNSLERYDCTKMGRISQVQQGGRTTLEETLDFARVLLVCNCRESKTMLRNMSLRHVVICSDRCASLRMDILKLARPQSPSRWLA